MLGSPPWEGEAPAEPDVSVQCSVLSAQFSVLSFQFSVIAKPTPVGADAPAEPGCSAQRELRPPRIAVNTSDKAVCSCAQDFALSLFFGRGKTWKNAE